MGFWSGAKSGFVGAAQGTWEGLKGLGRGAVDLATDPQARSDAWDATVSAGRAVGGYASDVYNDPAGEFNQLRESAAGAYAAADNFVRTADAEQWGELAGGGAFTVATIPVGGVALKGATRAGAALSGTARAGTATAAAATTRASAAMAKAKKAGKFSDDKPDACKTCAKPKKKREPWVRDDVLDDKINADGTAKNPPNMGFVGEDGSFARIAPKSMKGKTIDRYSRFDPKDDVRGMYFAKDGTPFEQRALPFYEHEQTLTRYRVLTDVPMIEGKTANFYTATDGGGTQYLSSKSVAEMLRDKDIEIVK